MSTQHNTQLCKQSHTTSPWTEAYHAQAVSSPATPRAAQQSMPERASDNEAQAPTHDALSAIYNRGY
ncbi:MAG: hypothetical protein ABI690_12285 [Chloroflexota bacterium]